MPSGGMNDRQEAKGAKGLRPEPGERLDDLARRVIGAAIEVHRHLGPGFSEAVYEEALAVELELREVPFVRQPPVQIRYKGRLVGQGRPDFLIGGALVVEIKAVAALAPVHQAQLISYLKAFGTQLGLLLNFKETAMRHGIRRVVWTSTLEREQKTSQMNKRHETDGGFIVPSGDAPVSLQVVKEDFDAVS